MSKIYQKMYPENKSRSEGILDGFIDKVILRSFNSGSHPFENIKRLGCRVETPRHDSVYAKRQRCRVKTSRHDGVFISRVTTPRHDDIKLGRPIKAFGHDGNINEVILRSRNSGSHPYFAKRAGFTLIELLVVVLIIGILAAVALPQYQTAVAKSRLTTLIPTVRGLKDAQEMIFLSNGNYSLPQSMANSAIASSYPAGCTFNNNREAFCAEAKYKIEPEGVWGYTDINAYAMYFDQVDQGVIECWALWGNKAAESVCKNMGGRWYTTFAGTWQVYRL